MCQSGNHKKKSNVFNVSQGNKDITSLFKWEDNAHALKFERVFIYISKLKI